MEYGLIGEKLGHSFSKEIHEMLGLYSYELREIPRDGVAKFMTDREFKGINVTIPYKEQVIPFLDFMDEGAKAIGAVNTVVNRDGKLYGYNTDFYGMKTLLLNTGYDFKGKQVLVLGTGGTSKTATAVLKSMEVSEVLIVSRTKKEGIITYEEACRDYCDADFIVNTTPSGMHPNIEAQAIDLSCFNKLYGIMDAIYNPARTRLMLQAEELNIKAYGGLSMLVYQAIRAAEIFEDIEIDKSISGKIVNTIKNQNRSIVLVGMPGSGKSTVGKRLAKTLNMNFIDTDEIIVSKEGCEISEIFANKGEKYFRDLEEEVVKECAVLKNSVISTGGGAILRDTSVSYLKAYGVLFFLDRKPETLVPTDDRPLADNKDKMLKLYQERLPRYKAVADVAIDCSVGVAKEVEAIKRYFK